MPYCLDLVLVETRVTIPIGTCLFCWISLKIESADYDNVSYPLVELGWSLNECISPVLYTFKDWVKQHFTPFTTM